jgi:hypothetical protein
MGRDTHADVFDILYLYREREGEIYSILSTIYLSLANSQFVSPIQCLRIVHRYLPDQSLCNDMICVLVQTI